MQTIGRQPQRAPDGAAVYCDERHGAEQPKVHHLVRQHAASFMVHTEASRNAELPRFITDDFNAFLVCGILARASVGAKARPFMSTQRGPKPQQGRR